MGPNTWHHMARRIPGADATGSGDGPDAALRIVAQERGFLVLNRDAFRREVVEFLWGGAFSPTNEELHSRSSIVDRSTLELELPDTHWTLPRTRFATREGVYRFLTPRARQQLRSAPDQAAQRPPRAPSWVPWDVWDSFLARHDGVFRYLGASRFGTTICLIKRNGQRSGYTEAPVDIAWLSQRMEAHEARMVSRANEKFNGFMFLKTDMGMHAGPAYRLFRETVEVGFASAFISVLGLTGIAAHGAGETFGQLLPEFQMPFTLEELEFAGEKIQNHGQSLVRPTACRWNTPGNYIFKTESPTIEHVCG